MFDHIDNSGLLYRTNTIAKNSLILLIKKEELLL